LFDYSVPKNVIQILIDIINRYARMQEHGSTANLTFDIVVPEATSTRHVAAAAFYHCLGGCAFKTFPDLARFLR
jgi:hypothetical protein